MLRPRTLKLHTRTPHPKRILRIKKAVMLFQTTRGILFEVGASARVGELLKNHSKHVLLVTDKFLHDCT